MSECQEEKSINILMLGSSNIKISYFIKLFSAYLKYDSYQKLMVNESEYSELITDVENVKETTSRNIIIGKQKFYFIDTPGLQKSAKNYKEILDIMLHFKGGCRLHAIIILVEPDGQAKENKNSFEQYTTHFLSGLAMYTKNILYVVLYNDLYLHHETCKRLQKTMNIINTSTDAPQKCNMFHFHEDTFYDISKRNWKESVDFSRDIFEYITGNGLESFYVHCAMPSEECFINLVCDLISILLEISLYTEMCEGRDIIWCIKEYLKNITSCAACTKFEHFDMDHVMKSRKCHEFCNCKQSILDVTTCSIFQTANKKCSVCNCDATSHRGNWVEAIATTLPKTPAYLRNHMNKEKSVIKSSLIQLLIFIQNYLTYPVNKMIAVSELSSDNWLNNLEAEIKKQKAHIRSEELVVCICKLFEISEMVRIFPKVVNENFPPGLQLHITSQPKEGFKTPTESRGVEKGLSKLQLEKSSPKNEQPAQSAKAEFGE